MKTLQNILATLTIIALFATTTFAGFGEVIDVNPSGVKLTIVDDADGQTKTVINAGNVFHAQVGTIISFQNANPNNDNGAKLMTGVVFCPSIPCNGN